METKTCGECSWFSEGGNRCKLHNNQYIFGDRATCKDFKQKPTNGDRIRQMSNEELEGVIDCPHFEGMCIHRNDEYPCKCCKRDWLNAPAESEGEDV